MSIFKSNVPSDETFYNELKKMDIKIIRLQSAVYWIDYIALKPS